MDRRQTVLGVVGLIASMAVPPDADAAVSDDPTFAAVRARFDSSDVYSLALF